MKPSKITICILIVFMSILTRAQTPDWQTFKMNGNACEIFTTTGNSRIIVPSYCFLLNGKPYTGELIISFKEYKDQIDFIMGGLNLRYEINGKLNMLQSGGMFEFKAETINGQSLTFATPKKVTIKFAIDPKFDVAGLEPYYFDPKTKRWVKNTRYGTTYNQPNSDNPSDLWQDEVVVPQVNRDPEMDGDAYLNDCYTTQIPDRNNPNLFIDTLICPEPYNILDSKYSNYMSKEAFKTMQIDNMGLYNYDKIFNEENTIPMFVKLKTNDGKPFELTDRLYVVYKSTNTVIYYYKEELTEKFSLLPRSDIKIFVYNADGSISKVPDSFWKNFDPKMFKGKTIELPFETLKLARLSKEEFAKYTGL